MEIPEFDWKSLLYGDPLEAEARVRYHIDHGLNPLSVSGHGKTLLHAAVRMNNLPVAKLAISLGVPVDARAWPRPHMTRWFSRITAGWTALFYGIRNTNYEICRLLLEHGASEALSFRQESPLSRAVKMRCEDIFWMLVEFGAKTLQHPMPLNRSPGGPPVAVSHRLVCFGSPPELLNSLEVFLLSQFGGNMSQTSDPAECLECSAGLTSAEESARTKFEVRKRNIQDWTAAADPFSYGFIRRCRICRQSISCLSEQFRPGSSERGIICAEHENSLARRGNREEDLLSLLRLRASISGDKSADPRHHLLLPAYWLVRCLKSHKECAQDSEFSALPRRVIDVGTIGSEQPPRLLEASQDQKAAYCALSYRWSDNPLRLLLENIEDLKVALPVGALPVQIQHAIRVARQLGFRYLWVDALCIIQNSEEDWKCEAANMGSIYFNSTLTIAAVDPPEDIGPDSGDLFTPSDPAASAPGPRLRGNLDTRGWVTQEEILSRRILSFTKAGAFWSCARWDCSDHCPDGMVPPKLEDEQTTWTQLKDQPNMNRRVQLWARNAKDKALGYRLWHAVLGDYTGRHLTRESDRFIALKGVESLFAARLEDQNLGGVWKRNVVRDLAWYRDGPSMRHQQLDAPSWSWGSATGSIKHLTGQDLEMYLAEDVQVFDSANGIQGSITFARGPLIPVKFRGSTLSFVRSSTRQHPQVYEPGIPSDKMHLIYFERGSTWWPDSPQYARGKGLVLHMGGFGLGVVPVSGAENTFKRIGLCPWTADMVRVLRSDFSYGMLAERNTTYTLI
ncbi:hypothetical protein RB601_002769 [Gaeumannomyces tritici]